MGTGKSLNASSIKTRIETFRCRIFRRRSGLVLTPLPLKQGLKQPEKKSAESGLIRLNASSIKTRIETAARAGRVFTKEQS